jgi:aryl-alcohol dehydrogenase-like predicted oxidoreductase
MALCDGGALTALVEPRKDHDRENIPRWHVHPGQRAERQPEGGTAVALAWLLQQSPNILLIPGTSSVEHLRANVGAATPTLSHADVAVLDGIAGAT